MFAVLESISMKMQRYNWLNKKTESCILA